MSTVIKVENLSKEFKSKVRSGKVFKDLFLPDMKAKKAVDDVSFAIKKGESVAFLGPNGAGKTTTTKILTGLVYPTAGEVDVLGYFPFDRKEDFLKRIGLVMGNKAGLNWDLTATQSFDLYKQIYEIPESKFAERLTLLTKLLDVEDLLEVQVRKLSLGERMKLELIGAIIHDPEVLFLDEPTIGLDINSKKKIRDFLRQIQKEFGTTLLLTSHDMDDVEKVCDRVIVINDGRLVYDDSLKNLSEQYKKTRYVRFQFNSEVSEAVLRKIKKAEVIEISGTSTLFKVEKSDLAILVSFMTENYDLDDIDIVSVPLEEIIADVFARG